MWDVVNVCFGTCDACGLYFREYRAMTKETEPPRVAETRGKGGNTPFAVLLASSRRAIKE